MISSSGFCVCVCVCDVMCVMWGGGGEGRKEGG